MAQVAIKDVKKALEHLDRKGWVSLRQLGFILGVAYPTIKGMADRKQVRYLPVGGIRRVYREEVTRLQKEGNLKAATGSSSTELPKDLQEDAQEILKRLTGTGDE